MLTTEEKQALIDEKTELELNNLLDIPALAKIMARVEIFSEVSMKEGLFLGSGKDSCFLSAFLKRSYKILILHI